MTSEMTIKNPQFVTLLFGRHSAYNRETGEISSNGKKYIEDAAREMVEQKTIPNIIFCSQTNRAWTSSNHLANTLTAFEDTTLPECIVVKRLGALFDDCDWEGSVREIRQTIISLPESVRTCAFVTHEVNLIYYQSSLCFPYDTSGDLASFMGIEYPVTHFRNLKPNQSKLRFFAQKPSRTFVINVGL